MKKFLFAFLFLLVSLFAFGFNANVKAAEVSENITFKGAQVRTSGNAGLRFIATENVDAQEKTTFGIVLAFGEAEADENFVIDGIVNGKQVISAEVTSTDNGEFMVTLYDIPASMYKQKVSARAYVYADTKYVYSKEVCVRSLAEVVIAAYEGGDESEFVKTVYEAVKPQEQLTVFNYNGGEVKGEYEFKVTRYNGGATGDYVTIATKEKIASGSNKYWDRFYLKATETENLWDVVAFTKVGDENFTGDYDYVIAKHENLKDATSNSQMNALTKKDNILDYYFIFELPSTLSCDVKVKASVNSKFFNDKVALEEGETLPLAYKDFYDFAGWYDNAQYTGEAVLAHNRSETYYAKFTPTTYEISYELNGGTCIAELVKSYNYESTAIILPTASQITKDGAEFVGWFDNVNLAGEPVTEIPAQSNGNITLYASWYVDKVTVVELSAADEAAISALTPTLVVSTKFTEGQYEINGNTYKTGEQAFATIVAALAAAQSGDKIYVFAGKYEGELTATASKVTLYGPNYNIPGKVTRNDEALIDGIFNVNAASMTINGVRFNKAVKLAANNVTISHCYVKPTATVKCNGQNRQGCIVDAASISNLTINYCYFDVPGTSNSYTTQFMSFNSLTTLTFTNNFVTNSNHVTKSGSYAASRIYNSAGVYNINNNEFEWGTTGYLLVIGDTTNSITELNFKENSIKGNASISTCAGIQFKKVAKNSVYNIIGNDFINIDGSEIMGSSNVGGTLNIAYNNFGGTTVYSQSGLTNSTLVFTNNYYAAAQEVTSDVNTYTHDEAGLAQMKADYAAYKAQ